MQPTKLIVSHLQSADVFEFDELDGPLVVAIEGRSMAGVGALLVNINVNGEDHPSSSAWRCTTPTPDKPDPDRWLDMQIWENGPPPGEDWNLPLFDDADWPQAIEHAAVGGGPWATVGALSPITPPAGADYFPTTAKWIWTADNVDHNNVYCRISIPCGRDSQLDSDGKLSNVYGTVDAISTDGPGTTFQLSLTLSGAATNVYTIYGDETSSLSMPPSYQEAAPFGANVGGVTPALVTAMPSSAYDSWLTVGITDGDADGALSSIGIDWDSWTATAGLSSDNGAVFWMSPDDGPSSGSAVVAQITVSGSDFQATLSAQGRSVSGDDWQASGITFSSASDDIAFIMPPEASDDIAFVMPPEARGCTDTAAVNWDAGAVAQEGSCVYECDQMVGPAEQDAQCYIYDNVTGRWTDGTSGREASWADADAAKLVVQGWATRSGSNVPQSAVASGAQMLGGDGPLVKNTQLFDDVSIPLDYEVGIDITPGSVIEAWSSIVHFTATDTDCCEYGTRLPGVWFWPGTRKLLVVDGNGANGNSHSGEWAASTATTPF
jgi:hypothetical protein